MTHVLVTGGAGYIGLACLQGAEGQWLHPRDL